jgi:hypothetical protein
MITCAPGAMPLIWPRSTPSSVAWSTGPPAAVVDVRADQLVVTSKARIAAHAKLASERPAGRRREAVIDQRGMLGPDTCVEHADDDAFTRLGRTAEGSPHLVGAEECRRYVGERLLERVLLNRDDTLDGEESSDLVRRQSHRHAAVDGAERLTDRCRRNPSLDGVENLRLICGDIARVRADGRLVLLELLARLLRARGRVTGNVALVARHRVVVELDYYVDGRGVGPVEQVRVGLGNLPKPRLHRFAGEGRFVLWLGKRRGEAARRCRVRRKNG